MVFIGKVPKGRATGRPTRIDTPQIRKALQSIQQEVNTNTLDARRLIGNQSYLKLIDPSTSLVNVKTGHMRRSYAWRVNGSKQVEILNTATSKKGFRYPQLVEKRYGQGTARTIQRNRGVIVRNTNRLLKRPVAQVLAGEV